MSLLRLLRDPLIPILPLINRLQFRDFLISGG
jgi:hypothetical protein